MNLHCFNQNPESQFIFQRTDSGNEHRERRDTQRSQVSHQPISPAEEEQIIRQQAVEVGADADSNLEQVLLQEMENEREARTILQFQEKLQTFIDDKKRLENTSPLSWLEQETMVYNLFDEFEDADAHFWKTLFEMYENDDGSFSNLIARRAIDRIHDQAYLQSVVEHVRTRPRHEDEFMIAVIATANITDQRYLETIARDRNTDWRIRRVAISQLTNRRLLEELTHLPETYDNMFLRLKARERLDELDRQAR